jgi:chromosomal replication initiator protein
LPTRRGIVRQLALKSRLPVADAVQDLVAARIVGSARELAGALHRLQATAESLGQPIDVALAEQALAEMLLDSAPSVRMADIERAVCRVFGLEAAELKSGRRNKEVSYPRMLAMWLARKHTRAALSEIGHFFGGRTHSTVVSAHKKVNGWMEARSPLELQSRNWTACEAIRRVEESLRVG